MNVFELFGKIAINGDDAMSGIDQTVGHAKKAESSLAKTFKKIGTVVAAAFSVKAVVDFGKSCTQAYANIAAEESAFAQIMGDYADTAQAKLKAVADQTGVSSTRMTSAMTSLTAKFKGLGYNVEDATTLAADGLLIASDAAAFWDMSLDESMSHLNSFINGSYEGGEAIGLFANDTQMAAFAIEQGIVKDAKAWAALDEAQRQATRLLYAKNMMEASGATGQAAKEADAYANVMANLKESWRQFQGVVGKPILEKFVLPAMQKLTAYMPTLTESVQNGIVWLEAGFEKVKGYFTEVFTEDGINMDALPKALSNMFRDLGKSAGKLLRSFGQTLRNGWANTVWPAIQGVAAKIGIELPGWAEIETKVKNWWDNGGFALSIANICNWTLNLFGAPADVTADDVSTILDTWWTNTKTFVQNACAWVLKLFSEPAEAASDVKTLVEGWWNGVKSGAESALSWVLKLFSEPAEALSDVETLVKGWWSGVKSGAESALVWTMKLFGAPVETADDVAALINGWWDNDIKPTLASLITGCCVKLGITPPTTGEVEGVLDKTAGIIGEVLSLGGEIAVNFAEAGWEFLQWIADKGETFKEAAIAMGSGMVIMAFAASPLAAALTALGSALALMFVDWENFETNYPQLSQMFEDLTGLDFTDAANSMKTFQEEFDKLLTWFASNRATFDALALVLGGVLFASGHPAIGAALLGVGGYDVYQQANDYENQDDLRRAEAMNDYLANGDYEGLLEYLKSGVPDPDDKSLLLTGGRAGNVGQSYAEYYDQEQLVAETRGMLRTWNKGVSAAAEGVWDSYRLSVLNGTPISQDSIDALMSAMKVNLEKQGLTDANQQRSIIEAGITSLFNVMTKLSPKREDIPSEWYLYDPDDNSRNSDAYKPHESATPETTGGEGDKDPFADWKPLNYRYDDSMFPGLGGSTGMQGILSAFAAQVETAAKAGSAAGVAEGMSGITVTGTITTGNVTLDDGTLVGKLAPRLDLRLGRELGRA